MENNKFKPLVTTKVNKIFLCAILSDLPQVHHFLEGLEASSVWHGKISI